MSGIGKRVGLPLRPSPLKFRQCNMLPSPKVFLKSTYKVSSRGKCQWIEGNPIPGDSTDKIKCMKPTVYNQHNKLTSWCEEHYKRVWQRSHNEKWSRFIGKK